MYIVSIQDIDPLWYIESWQKLNTKRRIFFQLCTFDCFNICTDWPKIDEIWLTTKSKLFFRMELSLWARGTKTQHYQLDRWLWVPNERKFWNCNEFYLFYCTQQYAGQVEILKMFTPWNTNCIIKLHTWFTTSNSRSLTGPGPNLPSCSRSAIHRGASWNATNRAISAFFDCDTSFAL